MLYINSFKHIAKNYITKTHLSASVSSLRSLCVGSIMFKSAVQNLADSSKEQVQEFLNSFDTVLTDCDGVLWIDNNAIPGSADTMNYLRKIGKKIFYVTNNSTKIRSDFAAKAQQLGFIASQDEILSTAYLVAHYLKGIGFTKKVYLIGSNGIGEELKAVGIRHFGIGEVDGIRRNILITIATAKQSSDTYTQRARDTIKCSEAVIK